MPARRNASDAQIGRGAALFEEISCAACHTPQVETGTHPNTAVSTQTIQPFSDLLLHDMGDGLCNGRPDFAASEREWRTAPLWEGARERFRTLSAVQRGDLLAFLNSL